MLDSFFDALHGKYQNPVGSEIIMSKNLDLKQWRIKIVACDSEKDPKRFHRFLRCSRTSYFQGVSWWHLCLISDSPSTALDICRVRMLHMGDDSLITSGRGVTKKNLHEQQKHAIPNSGPLYSCDKSSRVFSEIGQTIGTSSDQGLIFTIK